jgi:hypothetical protein
VILFEGKSADFLIKENQDHIAFSQMGIDIFLDGIFIVTTAGREIGFPLEKRIHFSNPSFQLRSEAERSSIFFSLFKIEPDAVVIAFTLGIIGCLSGIKIKNVLTHHLSQMFFFIRIGLFLWQFISIDKPAK